MTFVSFKSACIRLRALRWVAATAVLFAVAPAWAQSSRNTDSQTSDRSYYGPNDDYGWVEDDLFFDDPWYDAGDFWSESDWEWDYYEDEPYYTTDYDITTDEGGGFNDAWDYGWYEYPEEYEYEYDDYYNSYDSDYYDRYDYDDYYNVNNNDYYDESWHRRHEN